MLQFSGKRDEGRNFLGLRSLTRISASLASSEPIPVGPIAETFFEEVGRDALPPGILTALSTDSTIQNLRGRPAESFSQRPQHLRGQEEEIFFVQGDFPPLESAGQRDRHRSVLEDGTLHEGDSTAEFGQRESVPWQMAITTSFSSFPKVSVIEHRLTENLSPLLRQFLPRVPATFYLRMIPARVSEVRFGVENYAARAWSSLLGTTPVIHHRFGIEFRAREIMFFREFDRSAHAQLVLSDYYAALDRTLKRHDLHGDLLEQLAAL